MKTSISHIAAVLLGLVFFVSAFAKAWGGNDFADLVMQYGHDWFTIFVPLLIWGEVCIAVLLLGYIRPRFASLCAAIFIIMVSLVYLYGVLFRGITDCGCFGVLHQLNTHSWATFVRNGVLLILCATMYWGANRKVKPISNWQIALLILLPAVGTFICGLDMSKTFKLPSVMHLTKPVTLDLEQTGLTSLLRLSDDSTYVVYLFSYSCGHCQNSFANVEQYHTMHIVDHVYGLVIEDSVKKERFYQIYQPNIDIYDISREQMQRITSQLPVLFHIDKGKITHAEIGGVRSPGISL